MKKIIKLINNERNNPTILAKKALGCDLTSTDHCTSGLDVAGCTQHSYDYCNKDHAGCYNESYDYCDNRDTDACGTLTNYDHDA